MKDCAEVYRIGAKAPGYYQLDTSGGKINNDDEEVFCEEGWTRILTRNGEDFNGKKESLRPQFYFLCSILLIQWVQWSPLIRSTFCPRKMYHISGLTL